MSPLDVDALYATLDRLGLPARLLVAFSGGMDSTVLLHALTRLRSSGRLPPIEAVHIDHGLSTAAADWARYCEDLCRGLDIHLHVRRVVAQAEPGQSPEAAAREARYAALRYLVGDGDALVTAHHRNDQAETLLLQLLRGAGPAGLAAMPEQAPFGQGRLLRPLLSVPRSALRAYADSEGLRWIEDDSNFDTDLDRNFLRHEILPRIEDRWPGANVTLARAARLQAEAEALSRALALSDGKQAGGSDATLQTESLARLTPIRQRNLLRYWLREHGLPVPAYTRLEELRRTMLAAGPDRCPLVTWPGAEVRRYRGSLYALRPVAQAASEPEADWWPDRPLALRRLGKVLVGSPARGAGVRWDPGEGPLRLRWRKGGERCRVAGRRHHHALKKLFQEAGVPPWERDRIPLIYKGNDLVAVVGYWYCGPCLTQTGEQGWVFTIKESDES
jgi:tRNA(Ile)-lysidine synthase